MKLGLSQISSSKIYTKQTAFYATGSTALENKEITSIWHPSNGICFSSTFPSPHSGETDRHSQEGKVLEEITPAPATSRKSLPTEKPQRLSHPRVELLPPELLGKSTGREIQESKLPRGGQRSPLDVGGQLSGMSRSESVSQSLRVTLRYVNEAIIREQSTEDVSESSCGITTAPLPLPDFNDPGAGDSHLEMSARSMEVVHSNVMSPLPDAGKAPSPGTANAPFNGESTQRIDSDSTGKRRKKTGSIVATYEAPQLRAAVLKSLESLVVMVQEMVDRLKIARNTNQFTLFISEAKYWCEEFAVMSHRARAYVRLREDLTALVHGHTIKRPSSPSQILERLRVREKTDCIFFFSYLQGCIDRRYNDWKLYQWKCGHTSREQWNEELQLLILPLSATNSQIEQMSKGCLIPRRRPDHFKRSCSDLESISTRIVSLLGRSGPVSPEMGAIASRSTRSGEALLDPSWKLSVHLGKEPPNSGNIILTDLLGHSLTRPEPPNNPQDSETIHAEMKAPAQLPIAGKLNPFFSSGSPGKARPKRRDHQSSRPTDTFLGERSVAAVNYQVPEVPSSETTARSFSRAQVNPRSARAKTSSRFKQMEDELHLGPEYRKFKRLRKRVIKSGHDLHEMLETIDQEYIGLKRREIPTTLACIACNQWLRDFKGVSHKAQQFLRFREEWDALLQGRRVKRFASGSDLFESMRFLAQAIRTKPFFESYESLSLHCYLLFKFRRMHRLESSQRLIKGPVRFAQKNLFSFLKDLNVTQNSIAELGKQLQYNQMRQTEQSRQLFDSIFTLQRSIDEARDETALEENPRRSIWRMKMSLYHLIGSLSAAIDAMKESARSGGTIELASPLAKHLLRWIGAGEGMPQLDPMRSCASRNNPTTANPSIGPPTHLQPKGFELGGMTPTFSKDLPHKPWPKVRYHRDHNPRPNVRCHQVRQAKGEFVGDDERGGSRSNLGEDPCFQADPKDVCGPKCCQAESICYSSAEICAGKDDLCKKWPSSPWPRYISPSLPDQPTYNTLSKGNAHIHKDNWVKYQVIEANPTGPLPTNGRHLEPGTDGSATVYPQIQDHSTKRPEAPERGNWRRVSTEGGNWRRVSTDGGNWRRVPSHGPPDSDMTVARRRVTGMRVGAADAKFKFEGARSIYQLRPSARCLNKPRARLIDADQTLDDGVSQMSVLRPTADLVQTCCPQPATRLHRHVGVRKGQVAKYAREQDDNQVATHGDSSGYQWQEAWPTIRHVASLRTNKPEPEESSPYIQHHGGIQQSTPPGSVRYCSSVSRPESSRSLFSGTSSSRSPSSDMAARRSNAAGFHSLAAARIESIQAASGSTGSGQPLLATKDEVVAFAGSPLGYHIPSAKMRESLLASRSSRSAFWQYTFYQGPRGEKVKVHYCKSLETTERIAKLFLNESVVGFDIEWKPSATAKDGIRKNVALIQIASEERIALFHVARFAKGDTVDEVVSPTFKRLMESDSISKVGVSVKGDCSRLRKYMNIESRGLFELSHMYKLVKFCTADVKKINKVLVGLAKQVEEHLLLPMYKDESVRGSDWSEDLNYEQIYYAASDSYAGLQLYHVMNNKRRSIDPSPPLPAHADLNLPIRLANGQTVAEYEECSVEEPTVEEDKETKPLPPAIEQLVEDVKNVQIEDNPSSARTDQKSKEEDKSEEAQSQPQPTIR
ncbi:MAG: hypothetical protein Q9228_005355, partial [Teloschistes exilis]